MQEQDLLPDRAPSTADQMPTDEMPMDEMPMDLGDWRGETIELPPGFAPGLPAGREVLLFAPGMFEPEAEDFWSYAFLMEIEETGVGVDRLEELFELYYDGLIGAVGRGNSFELPEDPASVSFREEGAGFGGVVHTFDAFQTGEAIEVNLFVEVTESTMGKSRLRVQASPQERDQHPVWKALGEAMDSLTF